MERKRVTAVRKGNGGGGEGEGCEGWKWRDYLNIPYLRFVPRSTRAVIADLAYRSRGRHVIHVKPNPLPLRWKPPPLARLRPPLRSYEHFTFYFHAVLTPMCATFLTYSPDIGSWHVIPVPLDIHFSRTAIRPVLNCPEEHCGLKNVTSFQ